MPSLPAVLRRRAGRRAPRARGRVLPVTVPRAWQRPARPGVPGPGPHDDHPPGFPFRRRTEGVSGLGGDGRRAGGAGGAGGGHGVRSIWPGEVPAPSFRRSRAEATAGHLGSPARSACPAECGWEAVGGSAAVAVPRASLPRQSHSQGSRVSRAPHLFSIYFCNKHTCCCTALRIRGGGGSGSGTEQCPP